jgi:RNA-directed DNA polymerase
MTYQSVQPIRKSRRAETLGLVRYADDFVVLHHDKNVILACYAEIKNWLRKIGLEINLAKTRFTHTLMLEKTDSSEEGFDGKVGFNFLGFTIKQFLSKYQSEKDTTGKPLGYKTLLYPSKKSINKYQEKLHKIILVEGKGKSQANLISVLNPIIRGWANYFGAFDSNTMHFLTKADYMVYLKLRQWAKRVKGTSGKGASFFHQVGNNRWTFCIKNGPYLLNHWQFSTPSSKIIKVKGDASPYDGRKNYWFKRKFFQSTNTRVKLLFSKQKGICKHCGRSFYWDDILEVDHIVAILNGGSNTFDNLQLLHRHCHHQKTAVDTNKGKVLVKLPQI